jgi:hypothetical protein
MAVYEWEYLKIDLNQRGPREDELDLLNRAGADGWELVGISATNIAYLKRLVGETPAVGLQNGQRHAPNPPVAASAESASHTDNGVQIKYRDTVTGDTWTGRGRMARWLKVKQDAGEDITKYLVNSE